MSTIDDIRQGLPDFVAPELRATTARRDAIDRRFQAVDRRFEDLTIVIQARFDSVNTRIDSLGMEIAQVKDLLDFDRRHTRLEFKQSQVAQ